MYYALNAEVTEEACELLQAVIDSTGPLGLEIRDHTLKAPPGAPELPPGRTQLIAYYESAQEAQEALREVSRELPETRAQVTPVDREDWAESWKKHVKPTRVGRIWVGPTWEDPGDAPVQVFIEPGMAFGTGDHPTTSMCLAELDRQLSRRRGATVLDVGTGTGVLAIAARKLGSSRVVGTDIDLAAVEIARANAGQNGTPEVEVTDLPVERIDGSFDLVVANLFAGVLRQLAARLADRTAPGGMILATGILAPQAGEVAEAFEREGLEPEGRRTSGEWVLLSFNKR